MHGPVSREAGSWEPALVEEGELTEVLYEKLKEGVAKVCMARMRAAAL